MPPSVMATMCPDPGEDPLSTSHRLLSMLRAISSESAIRTATLLIAWEDAPFFRRFFPAMVCEYHS